MSIQSFTPNISLQAGLIQSISYPTLLQSAGLIQQLGPPAYEGPGLALFADSTGIDFLRSAERFVQADATDRGIYTTFSLAALTPTTVGAIYRISGAQSIKLTEADFSFQFNFITLTSGLAVGQKLYVLPIGDFGLTFQGGSGTSHTEHTSAWLRRMSSYDYLDILIYSENLDAVKVDLIQTDSLATIYGGYTRLTGFTGLVEQSLVGCIITFNGVYIGRVMQNTTTYVVLDRGTFSTDIAGTVRVRSCGSIEFATESIGEISTYDSALQIATMDSTNPSIKLRFKETLTIPAFNTTYANMAIKLLATERS